MLLGSVRYRLALVVELCSPSVYVCSAPWSIDVCPSPLIPPTRTHRLTAFSAVAAIAALVGLVTMISYVSFLKEMKLGHILRIAIAFGLHKSST
jgi:hypothetical protein